MISTHICSLVVTVRPAEFDAVSQFIAGMQGAEIAASDPVGKLVVVVETDHENEIGKALMNIEVLPGVLAAALVYHHIDAHNDAQNTPHSTEA